MLTLVPAPISASLPAEPPPDAALPRLLNLAFSALALANAAAFWLVARLSHGALPWEDSLKITCFGLLLPGLPGLWLTARLVARPDRALARLWALLRLRLAESGGARANPRATAEDGHGSLAGLIAEGVHQMRRVHAGREKGQELAHRLRGDTASLIEAASGIMAANARLTDDTAATRAAADMAEDRISEAIERAASVATATRATTAHITRMADAGASTAEIAFTTQTDLAALDTQTKSLAHLADQLGHAFHLAGPTPELAALVEPSLRGMQMIIADMQAEAGLASQRVLELSELIQSQHQLGLSLGAAVAQQISDIAAALAQLWEAHAGFATLRAGVEAVTKSSLLRLDSAETLRGAAGRLPAHADAIASILRAIPDFAANPGSIP